MNRPIQFLSAVALMTTLSVSHAAPFDNCPSKAFLFQGKPVSVFGINLVSGTNEVLSDNTGYPSNINAVGFDEADRYIYGFDTDRLSVVRLGSDYQANLITVSGLPQNVTIFVGDVFNHHYYAYRKNSGLYSVDLSPLDTDESATLTAVQVTSTANLNITDIAFHPSNGFAYTVDNRTGVLHEIDPQNGTYNSIGDTGETGTFGAMYFDVNGYLYLSRNQDGQIYRIDLSSQAYIDSGIVPAIKFADGPSSNQNDGARCANAPLIETTNIDFGDAPSSYGTSLEDNGPRHELDGITWLGNSAPDGEFDGGSVASPDDTNGSDDEDGVGFVTALEPGLDSIVRVQASTTGYLSAWFDWNDDGDFNGIGEQALSDYQLVAGENLVVLPVPATASVGQSWSRFRFSQQTGLNYFGGATSGEVEDHSFLVADANTSFVHFPGESQWVTLAYEDNWPHTADYDMNDLVLRYRITETEVDSAVRKITISGQLHAAGASYKNGFAVRLPGVPEANIDTVRLRFQENGVSSSATIMETGSSELSDASFIIFANASDKASAGCNYFRTAPSCTLPVNYSFELNISFNNPIHRASMPAAPYDPFLFATPGYYHGEGFAEKPGRSLEIHLADKAPTEKFDLNFLGLSQDTSDSASNRYFKTSNNLPWALLIYDEWLWPYEGIDLLQAYPLFQDYAESGGILNADWFRAANAVSSRVYE